EADGTLDCISMALTCTFNSWSRDGHKLVSASTDNIVSQWDVLSGDCDQRFRFPSPILKVQYHPRDQNKVLVCPMKSAPVMLTLSDSKHVVLPVDDDSDLNVVASFDRRGEYIYTGNAKGKILVLKTDSQDLVASFRVTYVSRADAAEDEEVDVTSVDPIAAFCSSDEELEDSKALLYLPIAPEVEDPEENPYGPPPDAVPTSLMDEGASSEKKRQSSADGSQPPKKKPKTTNIELQGVPNDEVHPLLGVKGDGKSKKKQAGRPKGSKGKEKDSPFKPKLYKGDRGLPLEGPAKGKVQAELSQPLA
ncbi:hypothetical protein A6R68_14039, partial [Neotoma lepida]